MGADREIRIEGAYSLITNFNTIFKSVNFLSENVTFVNIKITLSLFLLIKNWKRF